MSSGWSLCIQYWKNDFSFLTDKIVFTERGLRLLIIFSLSWWINRRSRATKCFKTSLEIHPIGVASPAVLEKALEWTVEKIMKCGITLPVANIIVIIVTSAPLFADVSFATNLSLTVSKYLWKLVHYCNATIIPVRNIFSRRSIFRHDFFEVFIKNIDVNRLKLVRVVRPRFIFCGVSQINLCLSMNDGLHFCS